MPSMLCLQSSALMQTRPPVHHLPRQDHVLGYPLAQGPLCPLDQGVWGCHLAPGCLEDQEECLLAQVPWLVVLGWEQDPMEWQRDLELQRVSSRQLTLPMAAPSHSTALLVQAAAR